jgi:penicillin-binding protein 2
MQKVYKTSRIVIAAVLVFLLLGVYLAALYKMQIYDAPAVQEAWSSYNAYTQKLSIPAARGDILDRNGVLLVSSRPQYNITISRERLLKREDKNEIILNLIKVAMAQGVQYTDTFPMTMGAPFSYLLDMTTTQRDRLNAYFEYFDLDPEISASDFFVWLKEHYGIDYKTSIPDARLIIGVRYEMEIRAIKNVQYIFAEDVDVDFVSIVKERNFPCVNVEMSSRRVYHTDYAAHILGYIGQMDAEEYKVYKEKGYAYNALIGKSGVERAFEDYLHGQDGKMIVSMDDDGTILNERVTEAPVPGSNVFLTIDIALQEVCENSLAAKIDLINTERTEEDRVTGGAVVVTQVKTGQVLAAASYPTFDLSTVQRFYNDLAENPSKPLLNRAFMGIYNPGSTFKMVTALAGLRSGTITEATQVTDTGVYTEYADRGFSPVCWIYPLTGGGHGKLNVVSAIKESCNYFFYWLGDKLGIDRIAETAADFGLGSKTGIELPESAGNLATPAYKQEKLGTSWYAADNIITAIGQGYNLFTPLQLANYVATIANGGTVYSTTILGTIRSTDYSSVVFEQRPDALREITGAEYLPLIQRGMQEVSKSGTAKSVFGDYPIPVASKTGTVQREGASAELNNGVFVCYAPADNPEIAIALVVEKGTSGATIMHIARDILDFYFREEPKATVAADNTLLP